MKSVITTVFIFLFVVGGITTFFLLGKAVSSNANLATGKVTEEQFLASQEKNTKTPWVMMIFSVLAGVTITFVFTMQRAKPNEQAMNAVQFQKVVQDVKEEKKQSAAQQPEGAFISLEKIANLTKPAEQTAFLSEDDIKQQKAFEEEMEHSDLFKEV